MSTVVINYPTESTSSQGGPVRGQRMQISPESGAYTINVRYAPNKGDYSDLSPTWQEQQRTGRPNALLRDNDPQFKMRFTLKFGSTTNSSVAAEIRLLARASRNAERLRVSYTSWEAGLWRISSMSVSVLRRHEVTDEITQADVDIEFTLASDISENIGPVTGGVQTLPGIGLTPIKQATTTRVYVVKKGDTLHKLAIKFYKNSKKWKDIAKENKIKNPKPGKGLKVGMKLKITVKSGGK